MLFALYFISVFVCLVFVVVALMMERGRIVLRDVVEMVFVAFIPLINLVFFGVTLAEIYNRIMARFGNIEIRKARK